MNIKCNDWCDTQVVDSEACGCCEGTEILTPLSTYNRPGLSAINYRIGTHGSFIETMTARLTGYYLQKKDDQGKPVKVYPLQGLTSRDSEDPALAFLDAWAIVADVLTFYQERIANEGYLRTATERRSVLEMARLVGYKPRPGVSSSVFLAYTLDKNLDEEIVIPAGNRSQSIPGKGELPQTFETSEDLQARRQWNDLKPRMTQPQTRQTIENLIDGVLGPSRVYLKGINTNIKKNDAILIDFADGTEPGFYSAYEITPDTLAEYTLVTFSPPPDAVPFIPLEYTNILSQLIKPASLQYANRALLPQSLSGQFALEKTTAMKSGERFISEKAHNNYSMLSAFSFALKDNLVKAVANKNIIDNAIKVCVLGIKANLFGYNSSTLSLLYNYYLLASREAVPVAIRSFATTFLNDDFNGLFGDLNILALDAEYPDIRAGDRVSIEIGDGEVAHFIIDKVDTKILGGQQTEKLSFYSTWPTISIITGSEGTTFSVAEPVKTKVSVLTLNRAWYTLDAPVDDVSTILDILILVAKVLQETKVYIQSSKPELAGEPIVTSVGCDEKVELDGFYDGLEAGRWVIVSGERDELSGVRTSELAMLSEVTQGGVVETQGFNPLPVDKPHTFIKFATKLAYCFKRDTVTIHGNVVKATHGETRHEILGSGNGAKPFQSFELKQLPLTHVSASNPTGIDSTLKLFVNDIQWHEADSLADLKANARRFTSKTDNEDKTSVIFGNGKKGARLPTGIENIRAEYRNGIGKPGNVKAEQISLLTDKPLGVKEVINPLLASGGANRENRDQARKHAPLAVKALDRLVSVQDYEDFSRIYAGIGKAYAVELSNNRQPLVHVTIAGAEDIPIDKNSDLFRNLRRALHDFGDPYQAIQLAIRELMFVVIEAKVAILPDYQWEPVEADLRARLLDAFSFERRELGQDVVLSDVISVIQSVRGVAYVDVESFGGIPEKITDNAGNRRLLTPDEVSEAVACLATKWSREDIDAFCANNSDTSGPDFDECNKFASCQKFGQFGGTKGVQQRLRVNLAKFEQDSNIIHPAQIAFISPEVSATLILNQIERLP